MLGTHERSFTLDSHSSTAARLLAACLVLLAFLLAVPAAAQAPGNVVPLTAGDVVPGQYIVVFNDNVADPRAAAQALSRTHGFDVRLVYGTALKGFAAAIPERALAGLARDPRVSFIEADQTVRAFGHGIPTGINRTDADLNPTLAINDVDDWRVDADVAVIDTGIAVHPDINIAGRTNCAAGSPLAQSCANGDGFDGNGHGTHVAGTIGGIDDNSGVVGMAPGARMWSVKVLKDSGSGYYSWVIAGVDWAAANTDIDVANMSLGGGNSDALCAAIDNSVFNLGLTIVVAAGNSSADIKDTSPANCAGSITVSALADFNGYSGGGAAATCRNDVDDTFANFSNFGAVDIIAPGVCIYSTWLNGGYNQISGTSMASPHVAGAAALLASTGMGPAAIRTALTGAGNFGWSNGDDGDAVKEPLLNVAGFVPAMIAGDGGAPVPPPDAAPNVAWVDPTDAGNVAVSTTVPIQIDGWDDLDAAGTLAVEWQVDGGAWSAAAYNGVTGYYEAIWDTSGMAEGSGHTVTARATDSYPNVSSTSSATVTVGTAPPPPSPALVSIEPLFCTMTGGKNRDKHMKFHIVAADADGGVGGITISVSVVKNGGVSKNGAGATDETGEAVFSWKNAGAGDYVLTVNSVTGADWDGLQPDPNNCVKF